MKNRTLKSMIGLCLIFVMVGITPSIANRVPLANHVEIVYTQTQDEIEHLPIETTLEPILDIYLNPPETIEESNVVVEYNMKTGMEEEYTVNFDEIRSDINQLEPFEGNYYHSLLEQSNQGESVSDSIGASSTLGVEELMRVNDTTVYPFSTIVKLQVKTAEGGWYGGSGTMIDSNHVITAGHMIYSLTEGGWMEEVIVIPGKNGTGTSLSEEPYGRAYATHLRSVSGWTQGQVAPHDWGLITLDRDIGNETGWMGVLPLPYTHNNYSDRCYNAGYPGVVKSGYHMYNNSGAAGYANEYEHHTMFYTEGGSSGSGVWTYQNTSPYLISIHAWGGGGGGYGSGTRISQERFDLLNLWLEQDASVESQVDLSVVWSDNILAALNQNKAVTILLTKIPITTAVQNYGNIVAETATLNFYLSEDENITVDDYLIGKTTVRNLEPLELRLVSKTVRIPARVPPGNYEIGWIIDPDNEIDEFFEDNNSYLNGLELLVYSTFLDKWLGNPLWLSLTIAGIVLAVGLPTVLGILRRRKRKQLAA